MAVKRGKIEAGPFALNALPYLDRGWSVIPVQPRAKECAVTGYTGRDGRYPTRATVEGWQAEYPLHNIAIRLPNDIIGIDVDAYGTKAGYDTLRKLENDLGELPHTYVITSRGDGISGIRLFRCPEGRTWRGTAGPGIDVLTWYHRYAIVFPSVHPETANEYGWFHEDGPEYVFQAAGCPSYKDDDIPALPQNWCDYLRAESTGSKAGKLSRARIMDWLRDVGAGEPCGMMQDTAHRWIRALLEAEDGGGVHDAMLAGTKAVIGDAMAGHDGMWTGLKRLKDEFDSVVSSRDPGRDTAGEWWRALAGAVRLYLGDARPTADPCAMAVVFRVRSARTGKVVDIKARRRQTDDKKFASDVEAAKRHMRVQQEARRALLTEHAAEAPEMMDLTDWLEQDIPPPLPLVPGLIALEGNTLLVAQPKSGKTTLIHNLIRSVADGSPFLDVYPVRRIPDGKRIALMDFEMHRGLLTEWIVDQDIRHPERVTISSLEGAASSFNILDPFCLAEWVERFRARAAIRK